MAKRSKYENPEEWGKFIRSIIKKHKSKDVEELHWLAIGYELLYRDYDNIRKKIHRLRKYFWINIVCVLIGIVIGALLSGIVGTFLIDFSTIANSSYIVLIISIIILIASFLIFYYTRNKVLTSNGGDE